MSELGSKNRSRIDIYFDILTAARQSVRKTHIMYRSNISYKQLDKYLDILIECDLIKEESEDGATVYNVTNRGLTFIGLFENLSEYLIPPRSDHSPELKKSERGDSAVLEREPFVY